MTSGWWSRAGGRIGEHVGQAHHFPVDVGHLDADRGLAGNRREHPDALGRHRIGDVLLQRGDLLDLHARAEFDLVTGDGRAAGASGDRGVDLELLQHLGDRLDHRSLAALRFFGGSPAISSSSGGSVYGPSTTRSSDSVFGFLAGFFLRVRAAGSGTVGASSTIG